MLATMWTSFCHHPCSAVHVMGPDKHFLSVRGFLLSYEPGQVWNAGDQDCHMLCTSVISHQHYRQTNVRYARSRSAKSGNYYRDKQQDNS